jgi:predicted PurR-regulated permease PerM
MTKLLDHEMGHQSGRVIRMVLAFGIQARGITLFTTFVSPFLWAGVLCHALNPIPTWLVKAAPFQGYQHNREATDA